MSYVPAAKVAQLKPCLIKLRAERTYFWCRCGCSATQPFCDGSHAGTDFQPLKYVSPSDEEVLLCACKRTGSPPFCDGAHTNLPGGSPLDDPESVANRAVRMVRRDGPRTTLNGACCVLSPALSAMAVRGSLRFCYLVSPELGAQHQTQLFMATRGESSPPLTFGDRHVILYIGAGSGAVNISGRSFEVKATDGAYVRPLESIELTAAPGDELQVYSLASPAGEIAWPDRMPDNFDAAYPERVARVDQAQRSATGPRYFQCLVDKRLGSTVITQFIGHIPRSKAAPHRHLYEEALIILSGEGFMWTESCKTSVRAGDVIFLPRKQLHSLQCTSAAGMDVVGVICPGDNPSITYYD